MQHRIKSKNLLKNGFSSNLKKVLSLTGYELLYKSNMKLIQEN